MKEGLLGIPEGKRLTLQPHRVHMEAPWGSDKWEDRSPVSRMGPVSSGRSSRVAVTPEHKGPSLWGGRYGEGAGRIVLRCVPCSCYLFSPIFGKCTDVPQGVSTDGLLGERTRSSLQQSKQTCSFCSVFLLRSLIHSPMTTCHFLFNSACLLFLLWFMSEFLLNQITAFPRWGMPYDGLVRTKSNIKFALSAAPSRPHHMFSLWFGHTSVGYWNGNESFQRLGEFPDISVLETIKTDGLKQYQQRESHYFKISLQPRWLFSPNKHGLKKTRKTNWLTLVSHNSSWRLSWHFIPRDITWFTVSVSLKQWMGMEQCNSYYTLRWLVFLSPLLFWMLIIIFQAIFCVPHTNNV